MNARYQPTRPTTRFAAALAAVLTVIALFDAVAGLADTYGAMPGQAAVTGVHIARAATGTESTIAQ